MIEIKTCFIHQLSFLLKIVCFPLEVVWLTLSNQQSIIFWLMVSNFSNKSHPTSPFIHWIYKINSDINHVHQHVKKFILHYFDHCEIKPLSYIWSDSGHSVLESLLSWMCIRIILIVCSISLINVQYVYNFLFHQDTMGSFLKFDVTICFVLITIQQHRHDLDNVL